MFDNLYYETKFVCFLDIQTVCSKIWIIAAYYDTRNKYLSSRWRAQ